MTLKYYFELVQLNDYSRLIESKIKVLVYMSTKLASDDVYSKTSWGTMTSGAGLGVCPKCESACRNAQKTNNILERSFESGFSALLAY